MMTSIKRNSQRLLLIFIWVNIAIASGCTSVPKDYQRIPSSALTNTGDTQLGRNIADLTKDKGEFTGANLLSEGLDAFAARMSLVEVAERSLDIQYYIWHNDSVGKLFASAVLRAAERGVRVRVLLDDIHLDGMDEELVELDSHPNIDIRIFNPFVLRQARQVEMLLAFSRINRRMHNKSFTADNQVTIVGGRNIGDEYYDLNRDVNFDDMDILAIGPVVQQVSDSFDKYWNNEFSIPITELTSHDAESGFQQIQLSLVKHDVQMQSSDYIKAVRESDFLMHLQNKTLPLFWGKATVVYDDPEKISIDSKDLKTYLSTKAEPVVNETRSELILISPYLIPGKEGLARINKLIARNVKVRILTNSLASTDVSLVYAAYKSYQVPMLQAGVELYESKPANNGSARNKSFSFGSSSRASLHTKLYIFDRQKLFIGSYNLDPRSSKLNTELGIIFDNKELAGEIARWWDEHIDDWAYKLALSREHGIENDEAGYSIEWIANEEGQQERYDVEPHTSFWRRIGVLFMSIPPIEDFL